MRFWTWADIAAKLDGPDFGPSGEWELPIVVLCWQGTGVDMLTGPPADTGRAVEAARPDLFRFQPVGNWPAATFPMGPSVDAGFNEGVRLATEVWPNNFIVPVGYSQGAICASHFWRDFILANKLQSRVPAGITYGNPLRAPGIANGNAFAGWEMPGLVDGVTSGGISGPDDLRPEQTPATWLDFVSMGGDHGATALYENAPVGNNPWSAEAGVGKVETSIYNAVQNLTLHAFLDIVADFAMPVEDVMAIARGFIFLAAQGAADHYNYDSGPAINYLLTVVANNTQVLGLTPPSGDTAVVV